MHNISKETLRAKGFTLIELLVAIAILAVLAAVLIPVFATVRERGRRTICQSNLKQIALAMQQYVQDNGGMYPPIPHYWSVAAYSYTKNVDVFRCPDHGEGITDQLILDSTRVSGVYPVDYTYDFTRLNSFLPPYPTKNVVGVQESQLATPASIWLNMDTSWIDTDGTWHNGRIGVKSSCGRESGGSTVHSGTGNYSFVDGHVKWLTPEEAAETDCLNGPIPPPYKN